MVFSFLSSPAPPHRADDCTLRLSDSATRSAVSKDGSRVEYPNVFPNIDLAVYRNAAGFEYDWKVAVGADASAINVSFTAARYQRIGTNSTDGEEVRHERPFANQEINGRRQRVAAAFDLAKDGPRPLHARRVRQDQAVGHRSALSFVSGIGGSGGESAGIHPTTTLLTDLGSGLALDACGDIYVTGLTYSTDCSSSSPAIAVDSSGNVYRVAAMQQGYYFSPSYFRAARWQPSRVTRRRNIGCFKSVNSQISEPAVPSPRSW